MNDKECRECGAELLGATRKNEFREWFSETHRVGAERFGFNWLAANRSALHAAAELNIDASDVQIRALLSRVCLRILADTEK
jgi:hypothetical protein